jgi:hypothetical protein
VAGGHGGGPGVLLAIERELGDPAGMAEALYNQGFILGARDDFDAAVRLFEESPELFAARATRPGWLVRSG